MGIADKAKVVTGGRFDLLVQSVTDYAIYMLDPTGVVVSWNAGAERFKGYRADEIIGQHFSRFYTVEERQAGVPPERSRRRTPKAGSRPRAGACARTVRCSGPMW